MRRHWLSFLLGLLGCNAILDNREGWVAESGASPTLPWAEGDPVADTVDAARVEDAATDAILACRADEHACDGRCVAVDDPAFGCGAADCSPCVVAHGVATCRAGACAIRTCERGRADCNQSAADGCEADLSLFETCGDCNVSCTTERPECAPVGETFGCITGCASDSPQRCDSECVDTKTNPAHCGECGHACGIFERCIEGSCRWL